MNHIEEVEIDRQTDRQTVREANWKRKRERERGKRVLGRREG